MGLIALPAHALPLEQYPEVELIIDSLVTRDHFDRAELRRTFADAQWRPEIIAAMERPHESQPWYQYRKLFLNSQRVRLGQQYWDEHEGLLTRAEQEFGVPAEIIVAIIGVETRFGANKGDYSALDALLTLSLGYPRRAVFFQRELEELLLLARELKLDVGKIKGSYAGALGIPQFMPSSYRRYSVDFDGNQRRDLIASDSDAIGSVASFLSAHGWITGAPIVDPAEVKGPLEVWPAKLGEPPTIPVNEWVGQGVFPQRESGQADDDALLATLVTLEGDAGPLYYLAYNNFMTITRYNRSKNYAMAVCQLGRLIRLQRTEDK